jgi:uncharacterized membrane protein YfcA
MILDPAFYLVAAIAVACLGLSKGGFAGFGLVATPLLALAIPPVQAAAILLPVMLAQDLFSAWSFRREWNHRIIFVTLPAAAIGIALAWALATYLSDAMVRLAVGAVGLLFALNHWSGRKPLRCNIPQGLLWGTVSGFTGTLANAGGPPFLIYVLPQQLAKMTFVGTMAVFFAALNTMKLVPFFALGQFSFRNLATSTTLLPLAIATNFIGIWLVRRIPADAFYRMTYALVAMISIALIWQGATGGLP